MERAQQDKTLFDGCCVCIRRVNYELHLLQHGVVKFGETDPWLRLVPALLGLTLVWLFYWMVYPPLLLLTMLALFIRPLDRLVRRHL